MPTASTYEHVEVFAGKFVVEWEPKTEFNPATNTVRLQTLRLN